MIKKEITMPAIDGTLEDDVLYEIPTPLQFNVWRQWDNRTRNGEVSLHILFYVADHNSKGMARNGGGTIDETLLAKTFGSGFGPLSG